MTRVRIFAKGNVDLHDTLHSCRLGDTVKWNGINAALRSHRPGVTARLKHETWTRSDALLAASGSPPPDLASRSPPLGAYPPESQFSTALFEADADVFVLSIQPDVATNLLRHDRHGYLLYPNNSSTWSETDRAWLRSEFTPTGCLTVAESAENMIRIVDRIRARSESPILVFNLSPIVPGDNTHCYSGLGETASTRIRQFNLSLVDLSERAGVSIVDVDTLIARHGADQLKIDTMHVTPRGYEIVAFEVVRILEDLGVI
jgi:lysophospholipase L1-like esterase